MLNIQLFLDFLKYKGSGTKT